MTRSKKQNDPFNAGDPSFDDDASSSVSDSAGAGEQPPESWDYDETPSSSSRDAKRASEQEEKRQEQERRAANQRKSSDYSTDTTRQAAQAQASAKPRDDKRRNHLWDGIVIILVLVCVFISAISPTNEEECLELVQERLDEVRDDDELRQQVADGFDALLIYYTDYGAEDLGLDADAYAEMVLTGFDYDLDVDDITCYSRSDGGLVTDGYASFYVTRIDSESEVSFAQEVDDYLVGEGLDYYDQDELTQEQLAEVQALYEEFIDGYEMEMTWQVPLLTLDKIGSDWELDEDEFEEEISEALCNSYTEEIDLEERAETVCSRTVTNRLDALSEDEDLHDYVASEFSEYLGGVPYDADDLGIDVDAFIDSFISSLWYEVTFVSTTDDSVEVKVMIKSVDEDVWGDFNDAVDDYLDEQGVEFYRSEPLTDAQKEHIRAMYEEVVASYDQEGRSSAKYMTIELTEVDGSWTIDEDSYQEGLTGAFNIY